MLRALFAVLVAVPALAWLVASAFDLPRAAEIGIVLMAISPGAPVALRRSLGAGGHQTFAPALQIAVAALAVISMPLSIEAFDAYYGGHATAAPLEIARQVFIAQLLPLALGLLARHLLPAQAAWLEPRLKRLAGLLLLALLVLVMANIWEVVIGAGLRVTLAIVIVTICALIVGHLMGGPEPATRTATAICSGARNAGLALLVATLNAASPAITAAVLAYFVIAFLTLVPYVAWRRRVGALSRQNR
jgi:BASS family bile acid:Na+ symporter